MGLDAWANSWAAGGADAAGRTPVDTDPPPQATIQPQAAITTPAQVRRDIALYNSRTGENRLREPCRMRATEIVQGRSEEHTSELQSQFHLVCRLLLEKK